MFQFQTLNQNSQNFIFSMCPKQTDLILIFLSSTYIVSPGPTSRKFIYLSFFLHSVSNFLGASLYKALVSGSGPDIQLSQDIEPSNSRAHLSHATLRIFSLAEHCHTQNFYLRCFKSHFDAVKSKFGQLIEKIKNMTSK